MPEDPGPEDVSKFDQRLSACMEPASTALPDHAMDDASHSGWTVKKKVLLVEDHPFTRLGITEFINQQPDMEVCGQAENVREALTYIEKTEPDLVLTDLSLPGRDGMELIKDLYVLYPGIPVLVLSMHDAPLYAERVLRAGGRGYITKGEAPEHLLGGIRHVLRGKLYLSEEMSAHAIKFFAGHVAPQSVSPVERLTDRELEVFTYLGLARSSREIAGECGISIKTVETHVGNMKQKFGVTTLRELSRLAVCWLQEQRGEPSKGAAGTSIPLQIEAENQAQHSLERWQGDGKAPPMFLPAEHI